MALFISYSRQDTPQVDRLAAALTDAGYDIWIDRTGIEGGTEWRHEIVTGIESLEAFILVVSPASIKSRNVRKEINVAEGAERKIIPVSIAPVTLPPELRYQLSSVQMLDMPDFTGDHLASLFKAIGGPDAVPENIVERSVADLSSMSGGGFLSKLANGKLFGRKRE